MSADGYVPRSLSAFREATMELDNVYSEFPKACGLSEAGYWSLLFIYEGAETQSQISSRLHLSRIRLSSSCGKGVWSRWNRMRDVSAPSARF